MKSLITFIAWLVPLSCYSAEAHAWGLYTHVYFAQQLVWAVPLLDPRLRQIIRAFPQYVLAGACLPDLAIFARYVNTTAFADNHQWETAERLYDAARNEKEMALAIGYASHLLADVIAHNHFVPTHEVLWLDIPDTTHIASEWAMDAHIAPHIFSTPEKLLKQHAPTLEIFVSRHFGCNELQARSAIGALARGDAWLRRAGVHQALYKIARRMDRPLRRRFDHYIATTSSLLPQLERVLNGDVPYWEAEAACRVSAQQMVKRHPPHKIKWRLPLPSNLFL